MQQQVIEAETEAAQVRVTPQELAEATAIIEARREAAAKHLADTIALGEAVQQLGLAATPEELFAEVQALRAKAQQSEAIKNKMLRAQVGAKQTDKTLSGKQAVVLFGLVLCFFMPFLALLLSMKTSRPIPSMAPAFLSAPQQTSSASVSNPAATDADRVRELNPGLFQSLDLKDGQTARCSIENIRELARGANPAGIWAARKAGDVSWQLARQSGRFCVQCWIEPAQATRLANGQSALVAAMKDGDATTPITLPLDKFADAPDMGTSNNIVSWVEVRQATQ